MAKFKCPNCKTSIEATSDVKTVVCPECGKKYKNPKYVEPTAQEPTPQAQPAPKEQTPQTQPLAQPQATVPTIMCPNCHQAAIPTPSDVEVVTCPICGKKYKNSRYVAPAEPSKEEPAQPAPAPQVPSFPCPNCNTPIEAPSTLDIITCSGCGKRYKNPNFEDTADAVHTDAYIPAPVAASAPAPAAAPATPQAPATEEASVNTSKFTGTMISWLGHHLFNMLLLVITLGLAYPWVVCRKYRWKIDRQVIDGHKLKFEGKGGSLFGHWLLWVLLTVITIGIYGLWVPCKVQAWITERTHIDDTPAA